MNQYICPICTFLFQALKAYTHYKCPSCAVVVQAIAYVPDAAPQEVSMPKGNGGVH